MDKEVREGWQLNDHLGQLSADAKGYVKTRIQLAKLDVSERLGRLASVVALVLIGGSFALLTLVFASFALARWSAVAFSNVAAGYITVAGVYLLLFILFVLLWRFDLRDRITLKTINELYTDDSEGHEETIRQSN